jgi:hypothetical protein
MVTTLGEGCEVSCADTHKAISGLILFYAEAVLHLSGIVWIGLRELYSFY